MSNDLTMRPAYLPGANVPAEAFSDTIGFAQPPRISMNDDRFNVLDENGSAVVPPSLTIDVIMLWENDTRIYYPKSADGKSTFDPSNPIRPTCWSDNKVTPSEGVDQPQSELCANCRHAVWDQPTPRGNLVPACDNRYKVACLVAGAGGRVFLLSVAPSSRRAYEAYRRYLRAQQSRPQPSEVITRLGYKDKALTFDFSGWVNEKTAAYIAEINRTDEAAMVVGAFDKPRHVAALPAPRPEYAPSLAPPLNNPVREAPPAQTATPQAGPAARVGPYGPAGLAPPLNNSVREAAPKAAGPAPIAPPMAATLASTPAERHPSPGAFPSEAPAPVYSEIPWGPPPAAAHRKLVEEAPSPTAQPATRRRGRPPADGAASNASSAAPSTPPASASAKPANGASFGMEAAPPPPSDIQGALDRAFGPR